MDQSELILATRAECGKVSSTEELADADILREQIYILRRISARITDKKLRSFLGEADEREYDVHENTVRVQKVYPSGSGDLLTSLGTHHRAGGINNAEEYYLFP